ncbi:MAG: hypothetical protein CL424_07225 [Acidimicrobiaceae bacterium]|nr:hypothetical protein [Acidimicrobiaceae bacterium]
MSVQLPIGRSSRAEQSVGCARSVGSGQQQPWSHVVERLGVECPDRGDPSAVGTECRLGDRCPGRDQRAGRGARARRTERGIAIGIDIGIGIDVDAPDRGTGPPVGFVALVGFERNGPAVRVPDDRCHTPVAGRDPSWCRPTVGRHDEQMRPVIAVARLVPTPVGTRDPTSGRCASLR